MNQPVFAQPSDGLMAGLHQIKKRPLIINQLTVGIILGTLTVPVADLFLLNSTGNILAKIALVAYSVLLVMQVLLLLTDRKLLWASQMVFALNMAAVVLLTLNETFSSAAFIYFAPSVIAYIAVCRLQQLKNGMKHFYFVSLISIIALFVSYFNNTLGLQGEGSQSLVLFRTAGSIMLSGFILHYVQSIEQLGNTEIRMRRNYYEALFQSYQDSFIIYKKGSNDVVECNARFLYMLNLPFHETLQGLNMAQVMMRYLSTDSPNMEAIMNGLPDNWEGEADFLTSDKKLFHAYIKAIAFTKDDTDYFILTIRDITQAKIAERELRKSKNEVEKAARAKARFLSSMSHELRTPLNGIIGTSNLLLSEQFLSDNVKKHINVLKYSSEHMLGIVNDILDFSKIDAGKMELKKQSFHVKESMDQIIASFENQFEAKKIELISDFDPQLDNVFVQSDRVKLGQVISNLLSNALKFTLTGRVTLSVRKIASNDNQHTLRFEVQDTGIGIPKAKQAEIFQGFTQVHAEDLKRDFGGTGLGLTISERLVRMFGGSLEVESELEQGSRFFFTIQLPVSNESLQAKEPLTATEDHADIRGVRVLVVEDNEINAAILKKFLAKWEVNFKEATHGIHALELLKYHHFDLVMMDLEMPEMDGYATIRKIRETNKELPVVAFTAALLENMESFIAENGFNDYILKPYRPGDLKKIIARYAPQRKIDY